MDNYKYYFVLSKRDDTYPLVNVNITDYRAGVTDKIKVGLRNPVPRKPIMCDFHFGNKYIFHKRIVDVMKQFEMEGVEFIPAEIDVKGKMYNDYICVDVDNNTYEALDKEKSIYEYRNGMYYIQKLVLDISALDKILLSKRLGMRLKEAPGYSLFHESVVDAIKALNPKGMYFKNIEEIKI